MEKEVHRRATDRLPQSQNQNRRSSENLEGQNDETTSPGPNHPNTPNHQPDGSQSNPPSSQSHRLGGHHRRVDPSGSSASTGPIPENVSAPSFPTPSQSNVQSPMEQLHQYLPASRCSNQLPTCLAPPEQQQTDVMEDSILPEEVKHQLHRLPAKSAPGPDKISYAVWKWLDWEGKLLAQIFEICQRNRKIPTSWKTCSTILIHKKGEENFITNWRPISLQNTMYKVYTALIAHRLASWALNAEAISTTIKRRKRNARIQTHRVRDLMNTSS